jgi:hypothetical protein
MPPSNSIFTVLLAVALVVVTPRLLRSLAVKNEKQRDSGVDVDMEDFPMETDLEEVGEKLKDVKSVEMVVSKVQSVVSEVPKLSSSQVHVEEYSFQDTPVNVGGKRVVATVESILSDSALMQHVEPKQQEFSWTQDEASVDVSNVATKAKVDKVVSPIDGVETVPHDSVISGPDQQDFTWLQDYPPVILSPVTAEASAAEEFVRESATEQVVPESTEVASTQEEAYTLESAQETTETAQDEYVQEATETAQDDVQETTETTQDDVQEATETAQDDVQEATETTQDDVQEVTETAQDVQEATETTQDDVQEATETAQDDVQEATETAQDKYVQEATETAQDKYVQEATETAHDEYVQEATETTQDDVQETTETTQDDVQEATETAQDEYIQEATETAQDEYIQEATETAQDDVQEKTNQTQEEESKKEEEETARNSGMSTPVNKEEQDANSPSFNLEAAEFVPGSDQNFNVAAREFVPVKTPSKKRQRPRANKKASTETTPRRTSEKFKETSPTNLAPVSLFDFVEASTKKPSPEQEWEAKKCIFGMRCQRRDSGCKYEH